MKDEQALREAIIKIVNENTILGEFKAVPVTNEIMQLIQAHQTALIDKIVAALPEKGYDKFAAYESMHIGGYNQALDEVLTVLEGLR